MRFASVNIFAASRWFGESIIIDAGRFRQKTNTADELCLNTQNWAGPIKGFIKSNKCCVVGCMWRHMTSLRVVSCTTKRRTDSLNIWKMHFEWKINSVYCRRLFSDNNKCPTVPRKDTATARDVYDTNWVEPFIYWFLSELFKRCVCSSRNGTMLSFWIIAPLRVQTPHNINTMIWRRSSHEEKRWRWKALASTNQTQSLPSWELLDIQRDKLQDSQWYFSNSIIYFTVIGYAFPCRIFT